MTDPKHRGRPRLDETDTSTILSVRLPSSLYDAAHQIAKAQRTNVPEIVRRALHYSVRSHGTQSAE
jgi:predicted transcriptional regulator